MTGYKIVIERAAEKALAKLPNRDRDAVIAAIDSLAGVPRPTGCTKLEGAANGWRIRVGNWRVVYAIRDRELMVFVVRIAHRREVYRGL